MPEGSERVDIPGTPTSPTTGLTGLAAVVVAALLGVAAYAGTTTLTLAYLVGALVVAVGWPPLAGLARAQSSMVVLAVAAVSFTVIVAWTEHEDGTRWVSAALAISLALVFLQSLVRRDGREGAVVSMAAMTLGLGVLASGCFVADALLRPRGQDAVVAAVASAAVGVLLHMALGRHERWAEWCLPIALLAGVGIGLVVAAIGGVAWNAVLMAGLLAAGVSHAFRAVLSGLPTRGPWAQLALGAAAVLVVGVIPTATTWLFGHLS